jgi:tRNA A37 threonylcarbamoyladenosine dehydratase
MTDNWLERTELLLGAEKLEKLRAAHVLVVGLGGVGAYAAEMIVRAGVGRMTVADADTVNPTNIMGASKRICVAFSDFIKILLSMFKVRLTRHSNST